MKPIYRVKDWNKHYENNRTRELKSMHWVPISNRLDGDAYTMLVDREDGAALFGAWMAVLLIASTCQPRGTLFRETREPHDVASLARVTRVPAKIIEQMLRICTEETKWMENLQEGA